MFTDSCLVFITFSAFGYKGSRLSTHGGKNRTERRMGSIRRAKQIISTPTEHFLSYSRNPPPHPLWKPKVHQRINNSPYPTPDNTSSRVTALFLWDRSNTVLIQILFSNLGTCIPNCLSPSCFTTNSVCTSLLPIMTQALSILYSLIWPHS